jgi:hypothetical protein
VFNTVAAMMAPCSVNAYGKYRRPPWASLATFEVAICDLKFGADSAYRRKLDILNTLSR